MNSIIKNYSYMNDYFSFLHTFRHYQECIEQNFNVSVVMPFYKKLKAFKQVFPKNRKYFERNGIEVIIVMDCPDEKEELVAYIQEYPFINWKVLYNDKPHDWRNPSKPINVGIRFATKKYIMVCSPESEFYTDAILQLRMELQNYPKHYAIGKVCFVGDEEFVNDSSIRNKFFINYGSFMVEKEFVNIIKGYDENLNKWGGDDDNIRARLELSGIQELFIPEVILIHRDNNSEDNKRRTYTLDIFEQTHYPKQIIVNNEWGKDFDTVIYDWHHNHYSKTLLETYLSSFLDYELKANSLNKMYNRILLVPTHNEQERIVHFLRENSKYFDAIILLDDESADATYDLAMHEKLILKVRKKRKEFNDLENRNILLNIVSFFRTQWIAFIDADEILDDRYVNMEIFDQDKKIDSILLNLIHLWDDNKYYNMDYPYTYRGISLKMRMFRNICRCQIMSENGKLHFIPIPYTGNIYHAPILIKHYGHLSREMRKRKYDFYMKEDTEHCQKDYSHLINNNVNKGKVQDISIDDLQKAISIY